MCIKLPSFSLGHIYVDPQVSLILDVSLKISHLEVIIDPVYYEVGEPGSLSGSLEQLVEQLKRLLPEVIAEDLEAHES